ncbi:response regulator [Telmatospirillum sp. J64-1]|uniref:response regulator n=1 Tax=Telmatospirillum sp. J64-1 TaxID=2502183 RepID=UPI00115CEFDC|nr:response regulator [Telmatospirillum sp. J64-1]
METSPHILVVDDNREIRDLLGRFLVKHGLRVSSAQDGRAMRRALETGRFDLVVLDLMLPGEDGLSLCRWLRATSQIPIVMLTAMGDETDRIVGLEMGADDYVPKPFNPRELLARIKAVLRRAQGVPARPEDKGGTGRPYCFAQWRFDAARRELVGADGMVVPLSSGEFALLLAFVEHPRRVLSRDQLLDLARGRAAAPFDRAVDTQVSRLRRKIEEDVREPVLIKTVWGEGYIFTPEVTRQ